MNWDDAYANAPYIQNAETFPPAWARNAEAYRRLCKQSGAAELDILYGTDERHKLDIFWPSEPAQGIVFFVHGGFWRAFSKDSWSHLATAMVDAGWAVVMPSYRLTPAASLQQIVQDIAQSLNKVTAIVDGPIVLVGHSAGGHLVTMLMTEGQGLTEGIKERLVRVVSISGLHDLTPLLHTKMNLDFGLNLKQAKLLSPALQKPVVQAAVTCWVGGDERPEFIRQNQLLAEAWKQHGVTVKVVIEPKKHHFDVIEGLANNTHPLFTTVAGEL